MAKLTKEKINEYTEAESDVAVYRMYTSIGYDLWMKLAVFYFHNHNIFTRILLQFPLFLVDTIDTFTYLKEKMKSR